MGAREFRWRLNGLSDQSRWRQWAAGRPAARHTTAEASSAFLREIR